MHRFRVARTTVLPLLAIGSLSTASAAPYRDAGFHQIFSNSESNGLACAVGYSNNHQILVVVQAAHDNPDFVGRTDAVVYDPSNGIYLTYSAYSTHQRSRKSPTCETVDVIVRPWKAKKGLFSVDRKQYVDIRMLYGSDKAVWDNANENPVALADAIECRRTDSSLDPTCFLSYYNTLGLGFRTGTASFEDAVAKLRDFDEYTLERLKADALWKRQLRESEKSARNERASKQGEYSRSIKEHLEAGQVFDLERGQVVCDVEDDWLGYVEDISGDRAKLLIVGRLHTPFLRWSGNAPIGYDKVREYRWLERSNLVPCNIKP